MADLTDILSTRFADALEKALGPEHRDADPILRPSGNPKFGDYQANLAMALGKQLEQKPRDLAQRIVDALEWQDVCDKVDIAGPGFINLTLSSDFLAKQVAAMARDERAGVEKVDRPQRVVVDYSCPNVAKEMHIGHLRSTIIGDCIARLLEFEGHDVVRQNHLGDWGTQFGMLIEFMIDSGKTEDEQSVADLNAFYQRAKQKFDVDADFADRARKRVATLQSGDEQTLAWWRRLVDVSMQHFQPVYDTIGVTLSRDDVRGESFYNDRLPAIVEDLQAADLLKESEGALVVYPEGFENKEGEPLGMIVRKKDGGFLYATTDLAAAKYRVDVLEADRVIYVTDARQAQHFAMVFQTLREAGWDKGVRFEHVPFGMILGKDRRPFKTREGGTVKLADVLDEAVERAGRLIEEKNPDLPNDDKESAEKAIGIGAVKYADLSSDRIKDYVFDWERMLSFEGNTAPYLQNAYVRIRSIFRKAAERGVAMPDRDTPISIKEPAEKEVALKLMQFGSVVRSVDESLEPHRLCTYLYELATAYHKFYENCPVLTADDEATRASRLRLCDVVARTLKQGLGLLGIETVERM